MKDVEYIIEQIEHMQRDGMDLFSILQNTQALIEYANITESRDIESITN